ncbi:putative non-specific serine/threonine protein kinase [Helianthus annuus]|nr:putative non-specific serine/threonine protein kinase [Helianthus annuus]
MKQICFYVAGSLAISFGSCHGGSNDTEMLKIVNSSSLNLKYSMVEKATNSLDEAKKLGQGGFGAVYKVNPSVPGYISSVAATTTFRRF